MGVAGWRCCNRACGKGVREERAGKACGRSVRGRRAGKACGCVNSGMSEDENKPARTGAPPRKRGKRPTPARTGELWAKCPECRMPVKDAELFKHLLNVRAPKFARLSGRRRKQRQSRNRSP